MSLPSGSISSWRAGGVSLLVPKSSPNRDFELQSRGSRLPACQDKIDERQLHENLVLSSAQRSISRFGFASLPSGLFKSVDDPRDDKRVLFWLFRGLTFPLSWPSLLSPSELSTKTVVK